MDTRFDHLPPYPFPRLRALLDGVAPGAPPIDLSLGEPRHPLPPFIAEVLQRTQADFGRYPPMEGTPALRQAIARWLTRRFQLPDGSVSAEKHVIALNGTREGLFMACLALTPQLKAGHRPAVLLPNPFYQAYAGAAVAAGAEPVYVPALRSHRFLPDFAALPATLLDRTAAIYLCSPTNPQGTCASLDEWRRLIALARRHDFVVFADECYSEIYDKIAPVGALQACATEAGADFANVLAFHSLSKRSNLPGLRAGFVAGDAMRIASFLKLRHYGGAACPLPVQAAATAAWSDEAHVEDNRARYRAKFDVAERILGGRFGYYRPEGGFYLWLEVQDGEAAALKLWRDAGVRVLPGRFLGHDAVDGQSHTNPGAAYIRVALVSDLAETETALRRLSACL